jgi:hypothetical protein
LATLARRVGFEGRCDRGRELLQIKCFFLIVSLTIPGPLSWPPATVSPGFKATADGGRVRKAFAGQEEVVVPYASPGPFFIADGPGPIGNAGDLP